MQGDVRRKEVKLLDLSTSKVVGGRQRSCGVFHKKEVNYNRHPQLNVRSGEPVSERLGPKTFLGQCRKRVRIIGAVYGYEWWIRTLYAHTHMNTDVIYWCHNYWDWDRSIERAVTLIKIVKYQTQNAQSFNEHFSFWLRPEHMSLKWEAWYYKWRG